MRANVTFMHRDVPTTYHGVEMCAHTTPQEAAHGGPEIRGSCALDLVWLQSSSENRVDLVSQFQ